MTRFLIEGPTGEQFELTDVEYFRAEYAPKGFAIVVNPPTGYDVPDLKPAKKETLPPLGNDKDKKG